MSSTLDQWYVSGTLGVATTSPQARLHVAGGAWDLANSEGDLKVGDVSYRLKVGVATGGGGAGDVRIRAHGGTNRLMLGSGTVDTLFVVGDKIGIGTVTPTRARLEIAGKIGSTTAIFGQGDTGVAFTAGWPGVGFNAYAGDGWRSMAPGNGGVIHVDPGNGAFRFYTSNKATAPDQPMNFAERLTITGNGELYLNGKPHIPLLIQNGTNTQFNMNARAAGAPVTRTVRITFPRPYASPPQVVTALSTIDANHDYNLRFDVRAANITSTSFDLVFYTWSDTHIFSITGSWMAYGAP